MSMISVCLSSDGFFEVARMFGVMETYFGVQARVWPCSMFDSFRIFCLCAVMLVGARLIGEEVEQDTLLARGCLLLFALAASLSTLSAFSVSSALLRQNDFQFFLSHAKESGGAVARLFKIMLAQTFLRFKVVYRLIQPRASP